MARPNLNDLRDNFRDYDGPLERKLVKAVSNNVKKLVTLSECCGNLGEPGC